MVQKASKIILEEGIYVKKIDEIKAYFRIYGKRIRKPEQFKEMFNKQELSNELIFLNLFPLTKRTFVTTNTLNFGINFQGFLWDISRDELYAIFDDFYSLHKLKRVVIDNARNINSLQLIFSGKKINHYTTTGIKMPTMKNNSISRFDVKYDSLF